jgi:hypothetical protein
MFGQFLPNKNKMLQYSTVIWPPQFGPTKQGQSSLIGIHPYIRTVRNSSSTFPAASEWGKKIKKKDIKKEKETRRLRKLPTLCGRPAGPRCSCACWLAGWTTGRYNMRGIFIISYIIFVIVPCLRRANIVGRREQCVATRAARVDCG